MKRNKKSSKQVGRQRAFRRKWVTFLRMVRYGINNFSRNVWLTIAATAVMSVTLLFIFASLTLRSILLDNVAILKNNVDMSIYLKSGTTEDQANQVIADLNKLKSVKSVTFISSDDARSAFIEQNKSDAAALNALNLLGDVNQFPATLHIKVVDINNTTELQNFVDKDQVLKNYIDLNRKPSFAGSRKTAIENIARMATFAEQVGIVASILFVFISSLIIFNTIQMAIFSRKEEIEMMKLIGAEKSFIRGPFVVEAIVYGFIAAIVASAAGYGLMYYFRDGLSKYISVNNTIQWLTMNLGLVIGGMILVGALIGALSSMLATRKHLRV